MALRQASANLLLVMLVVFSAFFLLNSELEGWGSPIPNLIFLEYLVVLYIFFRIKQRNLSFLLLLFPIFKSIYFSMYDPAWVSIGDFSAYIEMLQYQFPTGLTWVVLLNAIHTIGKFYYLTIFNMYIPMRLYDITSGSPNAAIFLYFNDFVFLILTAMTVNALKSILDDKIILFFVIFLLFSPTTLADTIYPDRHIFSLFALLWFVSGCIRIRNGGSKLDFYLIISLVLIFINKPQLLIAILLYIIYLNRSKFLDVRWLLPMLSLLALLVVYNLSISGLGVYLAYKEYGYAATAIQIQRVMGPLYYLVMPIVKYIYGLFSPFPWYKFSVFLIGAAGSPLTLAMVYFNSVFGVGIVIALFRHFKQIKSHQFYYENFILFGLIMSLTIIPADIGHSGYLALYYVLFLPIFFILGWSRSAVIFFSSLILILLLNLLVFFA